MAKYYKHPAYGRVYGDPIRTPVGRVAWPSLTAPKESKTPDGNTIERFEVTLLIDKECPKTAKFIEKLSAMVHEGDEDHDEGMLSVFNEKTKAKLSLGEGEELLKDGDTFDMEKYPYYAGQYIIQARNGNAIGVRDGNKNEINPDIIKGGVKAVLVITPHLGPTGLSFRAERVQFIEDDGTRFGGGLRNVDSLLDNLEEEDKEEEVEEVEAEVEETEVEEVEEVEEETPPPAPKVKAPVKKVATPPPPIKAASTAAIKATPLPPPAPNSKAEAAANLRAQMAAKMQKSPAVGKAVTTGKGKALALDNL